MKSIIVIPPGSKFPVKLFCCITFGLGSSDCYLLKSILSSYNSFWSKRNSVDKRLCNDLLDLSQFFECYHMFFEHFLLANQKFFHQLYNCNLLFLHSKEKISCNLFSIHNFQMIKWKVYLLPGNLDQLSNLNIGFVSELMFLIDIYSSQLLF